MIRFSLLPSHPKHLHVHLLGIGIVELALAQLAVEADDLAEFVLHLLNVFHTDRCHFRLLQLKRGGKERNSHREIQRGNIINVPNIKELFFHSTRPYTRLLLSRAVGQGQ